jgi:hypothetical protein
MSASPTLNFDVGDKTPVRPVTLRDITAPLPFSAINLAVLNRQSAVRRETGADAVVGESSTTVAGAPKRAAIARR